MEFSDLTTFSFQKKNERIRVPIAVSADQGLVDRLLADTNEWNRWRAKENILAPYLMDADLRGADLKDANLHGAVLIDADLRDTNLNRAVLDHANLSKANLSGAVLQKASLYYSNLSRADLTGANLRWTFLSDTIFADTNLKDAKNLNFCEHLGPCTIDHRTLERSGALPISFLRGCGLSESIIDYLPSLLNQPISFYSCFISYSHADKVFARRLHDQLQGRGIRCWLDEHQLLPGDDIFERVDQGIKLWDKVLLCASKDSLTSWWVDNEIDSAFRKEQKLMEQREHKVWSLIPLNLDGYLLSGKWIRGMAGQVNSRMAADFTGWEYENDKFEQAFERVVKALETDESGRVRAPESKL